VRAQVREEFEGYDSPNESFGQADFPAQDPAIDAAANAELFDQRRRELFDQVRFAMMQNQGNENAGARHEARRDAEAQVQAARE